MGRNACRQLVRVWRKVADRSVRIEMRPPRYRRCTPSCPGSSWSIPSSAAAPCCDHFCSEVRASRYSSRLHPGTCRAREPASPAQSRESPRVPRKACPALKPTASVRPPSPAPDLDSMPVRCPLVARPRVGGGSPGLRARRGPRRFRLRLSPLRGRTRRKTSALRDQRELAFDRRLPCSVYVAPGQREGCVIESASPLGNALATLFGGRFTLDPRLTPESLRISAETLTFDNCSAKRWLDRVLARRPTIVRELGGLAG